MKAVGTWQGGFRTLLEDSSGHTLLVDLPRDEGGENVGPYALELSVLSLAGCITTIFALVAKRRRVKFEGLTVELEAHRPKGAPTIASVDGTARVWSSAPSEEVATALEITLRTCPVGVLYEQAHVPVRVQLEVMRPAEGVPSFIPA
jgi:putative redox protein